METYFYDVNNWGRQIGEETGKETTEIDLHFESWIFAKRDDTRYTWEIMASRTRGNQWHEHPISNGTLHIALCTLHFEFGVVGRRTAMQNPPPQVSYLSIIL